LSLYITKHSKFKIKIICVSLLLLFTIIVLTSPVKGTIKSALNQHLIVPDAGYSWGHFDAAYVLGGSPDSLLLKFRKAALLYKKGTIGTFLVPHRSGITEYYPQFKRNLKNDEWSVMKLRDLGVPESKIKIVHINEGFFGTYSEAKSISALVRKRGYRSLLLITAAFHTKRTKLSFQNFLDPGIRLAVVSTDEKVGLLELLSETLKLQVYRLLLLSSRDSGAVMAASYYANHCSF